MRPFLFCGMPIEVIYTAYLKSSGVCTDTRKISENCFFVALKGPNFNANDFVLQALSEGASFCVADEDRPEFKNNARISIVPDGLEFLQNLARHHRSKLKIPVVALSGSNGKTTSKEILRAALSEQYTCLATKGNLNNHIGVPLTLLEINQDHEIAIIEMGANHQKEISFLCDIARPDYAYLTNIGSAHLEGFGGLEGVYKGKKELFDFIDSSMGTLFVNTDDTQIVKAAGETKKITYGSADSHFQGSYVIENDKLTVSWWRDIDPFKRSIKTQLTGAYNFSNVLSAVAIARYFGVPDDDIRKGIEKYTPSNNRSQLVHTKQGNTVIVDCYNANPSSMDAALDNLNQFDAQSKVAILGDMLELGEAADAEHQKIVSKVSSLAVKGLFVGDYFAQHPQDGAIHVTETPDLASHLKESPIKNSTILLKGSRKMKLETLLELL